MLPKIYVSILLYKRVVDFILVCTYLGCKLGRKRRLINRFSNAAKVGNGYRTVVGMLCGSQSREAGINRSSTLLKTSSIYPTRIIVTRPHGYIHNVKCYGYRREIPWNLWHVLYLHNGVQTSSPDYGRRNHLRGGKSCATATSKLGNEIGGREMSTSWSSCELLILIFPFNTSIYIYRLLNLN